MEPFFNRDDELESDYAPVKRKKFQSINDIGFIERGSQLKRTKQIGYQEVEEKWFSKLLRPITRSSIFIKVIVVLVAVFSWRLAFSDNGYQELLRKKEIIGRLEAELDQVSRENSALRNEMYLIRGSESHQTELVRNFLGFIATDEYLVIFPEER